MQVVDLGGDSQKQQRERVRERESKRARTRERTEEDQRTTQGGIIELITTEGH